MSKGKRRQKTQSAKRRAAADRNRPGKDGDNSNYGRKRAYCQKHGVWGFQVPNPKPWRGKR